MRTTQTFSISFFIRKKKKQPELALIYARVTVNKSSLEISLKRTISENNWSPQISKVQGTSTEAKT